MEINHNQTIDDRPAVQIAKLESELAQIKWRLDLILKEGMRNADLVRWETNIYVAISKATTRIILLLCTLIILSHAVYPIIYSCP